jgi:hypothetical protein
MPIARSRPERTSTVSSRVSSGTANSVPRPGATPRAASSPSTDQHRVPTQRRTPRRIAAPSLALWAQVKRSVSRCRPGADQAAVPASRRRVPASRTALRALKSMEHAQQALVTVADPVRTIEGPPYGGPSMDFRLSVRLARDTPDCRPPTSAWSRKGPRCSCLPQRADRR